MKELSYGEVKNHLDGILLHGIWLKITLLAVLHCLLQTANMLLQHRSNLAERPRSENGAQVGHLTIDQVHLHEGQNEHASQSPHSPVKIPALAAHLP